MRNRPRPTRRRINGHGPDVMALVVPHFPGVDTADWSDTPPAAYPPATIERVIAPRLAAGEDLIRLNGYLCGTCKSLTLTYDRHPGIAPAMVDHNRFDPDIRCEGMTTSVGYDPDLSTLNAFPSHEWFRPSEVALLELARKREAILTHVLAGGLLLRQIPLPGDSTPADPEKALR